MKGRKQTVGPAATNNQIIEQPGETDQIYFDVNESIMCEDCKKKQVTDKPSQS